MSTRTNLRPQPIIPSPQGSPANSASMAANITSAVTILQSLTLVNYAVSWTGSTPIGTLAVEASTDYAANGTIVTNAGTWNPLPLDLAGASVTSIPITGNTGHGMIDIDGLAAYAIRLVYTAGSGTGTLSATINGKVA